MIYDFRIDILRNNIKIGEALCDAGLVRFDKRADVSLGLQLSMSADRIRMQKAVSGSGPAQTYTFDMFSDRLRPVLIKNGIESPLGTYMVIASPEKLSYTGSTYSVEAYDETMILKQAAFTERTNYTAGTRYLTVINSMLTACGFARVIEDPTEAVLATDIEVAPGRTYLEVINEFLDGINYEHVHADGNGNIYVQAVQDKQTADHIYSDKKNMSIIPPITRTTDIYSLPNVITGMVSLPEIDEPLVYTRENVNPDSKISIPSRGYKVVKIYNLSNSADESTLKDYVDQKYYEFSQITEKVEIVTEVEGNHLFGDTVQLDTNLIAGLYDETEWEIRFDSDGTMRHALERKIFV